jgi:hypothetical protein
VAFSAQLSNKKEGIFVAGAGLEMRSALAETFYIDAFTSYSGLSLNFHHDPVVQINNQNRVAWRVWSRDGLYPAEHQKAISYQFNASTI